MPRAWCLTPVAGGDILHLALYHPAIPQNTGNISRTTVGFGAALHLIHPMSFAIDDTKVKRAGLDHWDHVRLTEHANDDAFLDWLDRHLDAHPGARAWLVTKFGSTRFDRIRYGADDVLILGNENTGLPQHLHDRFPETRVSIPMPGAASSNLRSYNLANAAAILLATATCQHLP